VEGLVHVGFGNTDIILELFGNRFPQRMYQTKNFITLGYGIENYSKRYNIVYLFKGKILGNHFLIDAVMIFVSAENFAFKIVFIQLFIDNALDGFNILLAFLPFLVDQAFYFRIFFRLKILK